MIASLALFLCCFALPQDAKPASDADRIAEVERLYAENRWEEIVARAPAGADAPSELDFYRGLALARLQRWGEAQAAFEAGHRKQPRDKRFLLELAGVAYQRKNLTEARAYLSRALRLDPGDAYARNFLATVYFLQGNLEAALEHWNRIGKPKIAALRFDPEPRVRPELLDRAFAFAPLDTLRKDAFETTRARLDNLEIFSQYRFDLVPNEDQSFAVVFRAIERNGWGDSLVAGLVGFFRGLPYQTIYPEFYNLNRSATDITSMLRWNPDKRRAGASLSMPFGGSPALRFVIYLDGRNENWEFRDTLHARTSPVPTLNLEKAEAGAEFRAVASARWGWWAGLGFGYRRFRSVSGVAPGVSLFTDGFSLESRAGVRYQLLRNAGRRIAADGSISGGLGRAFARPLGAFGKLEGSVALRWLPASQGDDYETSLRFRAGRIFGDVPFDHVYQLGIERDNGLWLRGHVGTHDGKKGSAPLGREYVLWNWEADKILHQGPLLTVKLGPLVDFGRIADPSGNLVSPGWLVDPGAQLKLRLLASATVIFSYGKDLRTGRNAFYTVVTR